MSINKFNSEGYYDPTAYEAMTAVEKEERALRAFRPIVYICSPYAGNVSENIENARKYSRFAVDKGYIPVAPHLLFPQFLNDNNISAPIVTTHKEGCCPQCGKEIIQSGKTKKRRFCSDACRKLWWKEHPNLSSETAVYSFICAECGIHFTAYGNRNRKFCCHDCYVQHRIKAGGYRDN